MADDANGDRLFLIVGNGRSGTTLLSVLLDRHPRIAVPGETHYFKRLHNPGHLLFRLRGGFSSHRMLLERRHFLSDEAESRLDREWIAQRFLAGQATPARLFALAMRSYANARDAEIAGEKTPAHIDHFNEIFEGLPNARAVCMVRDGRDSVLSWIKAPISHRSTWLQARRWNRRARLCDAALRRWPERTLLVRYEELVRQPEQTLRRVCDFLGVEYEPRMLDPETRSHVDDAPGKPWRANALDRIDPSRAAVWRRELSDREARMLTWMMRRHLTRFGYPTEPADALTFTDRLQLLGRIVWGEAVTKPLFFSRLWFRAALRWLRGRLPTQRKPAPQRDAAGGTDEPAPASETDHTTFDGAARAGQQRTRIIRRRQNIFPIELIQPEGAKRRNGDRKILRANAPLTLPRPKRATPFDAARHGDPGRSSGASSIVGRGSTPATARKTRMPRSWTTASDH